MNKTITTIAILALAFTWANCGGGGEEEEAPTTTITLSGQVAVSSSDLNLSAMPKEQVALAKSAPIKFLTKANSALTGATVQVYKIFANGTEEAVSGATDTTDSEGNYSIADVPVASTGTGAATDFYYEVRATSGSLDVRAPTAPTADTTVNLSPETKIAAKIISDVATAGGAQTLPHETLVENVREMVADSVADLGDSISLPSTSTSVEDTDLLYKATAIASDGANSEAVARAYEFAKEELSHEVSSTDAAEVAPYIERVVKHGCDFNQNLIMPREAVNVLADAFIDDQKFTPEDVVNAYNKNAASTITTANAVASFGNILSDLDTAFSQKGNISSDDIIGLYVQRDLDPSNFTSSVELKVDQALAFLQAQSDVNCGGGAGVDFVGFAGDLLGTPITQQASIADVDLYSGRYGGCPDGTLQGRVIVYSPTNADVTGLTTAGDIDTLTLQPEVQGSKSYRISADDPSQKRCLTFGTTYDLTISATFNDGQTATTTHSLTPISIPEAYVTSPDRVDGDSSARISNESSNPIHMAVERPIFKWNPAPGTAEVPSGAPAGSKIAYLLDIGPFSKTLGAPENRTQDPACQVSQISRPFDRNFFLAPNACDAAACDTALGTSGDHICRLHVQVLLVDKYDRQYSWAAGADAYYCIDGQAGCE